MSSIVFRVGDCVTIPGVSSGIVIGVTTAAEVLSLLSREDFAWKVSQLRAEYGDDYMSKYRLYAVKLPNGEFETWESKRQIALTNEGKRRGGGVR